MKFIKYSYTRYTNEADAMEFEKETKCFYVDNCGRRHLKEHNGVKFLFDSEAECLQYNIAKILKSADKLKNERENLMLGAFKAKQRLLEIKGE